MKSETEVLGKNLRTVTCLVAAVGWPPRCPRKQVVSRHRHLILPTATRTCAAVGRLSREPRGTGRLPRNASRHRLTSWEVAAVAAVSAMAPAVEVPAASVESGWWRCLQPVVAVADVACSFYMQPRLQRPSSTTVEHFLLSECFHFTQWAKSSTKQTMRTSRPQKCSPSAESTTIVALAFWESMSERSLSRRHTPFSGLRKRAAAIGWPCTSPSVLNAISFYCNNCSLAWTCGWT